MLRTFTTLWGLGRELLEAEADVARGSLARAAREEERAFLSRRTSRESRSSVWDVLYSLRSQTLALTRRIFTRDTVVYSR